MADATDQHAADLSFRMSKKIAQLTKVIYQLNCRNEDNEASNRALCDAYEAEIGDMMSNARQKITQLRDELQSKRDERRIQQALEALGRQHAKEKDEAMRVFDAWKAKAQAAELEVAAQVEQRHAALVAEVAQLRRDYDERIKALSSSGAAQSSKAAEELEALRKAKDAEAHRLVQEYNERYKAMLAQQMDEQEQLERRLAAEWQAKLDALKAATAAQMDSAASVARASGDKASAALQAATARVAQLESDLKARGDELSAAQHTEAALRSELAELKRRAQDDGAHASDAVSRLEERLRAAEAATLEVERKLQTEQEGTRRLTASNQDLQNELGLARAEVARLERELQERESAAAALADKGSNLADKLSGLERALAAKSQEAAQLSKANVEQAKRVQELEASLAAAAAEAERQRAEATAAREKAAAEHKAALDALRDSLSAASKGAAADAAQRQQKDQRDSEARHAAALAALRTQLEAAAEARIRDKERESATLLAAANKAAAATETTMKARITALEAQVARLEASAASATDSAAHAEGQLRRELADTKAALAAAVAAAADAATTAAADLDAERKRAAEAALGAAAAAGSQEKLLADARAATAAAEARAAKAHAECEALQAQAAQQREAHAAELAALQRRHDEALRASGSDKDRAAAAERQRAVDAARTEMQAAQVREIAALRAAHDAAMEEKVRRIRALELQVQNLEADANGLRQDIAGLNQKLADAAAREREMSSSSAGREDHLRAELARVRDEHAAKLKMLEAAADKLRADHAASTAAIEAHHAAVVADATAAAAAAAQQKEQEHAAAVAALQRRLTEERERALHELNERLSGQLQGAAEKHAAEFEALRVAKGTVEREFEFVRHRATELEGKLSAALANVGDLRARVQAEGERYSELEQLLQRRAEEATVALRRAVADKERELEADHTAHLEALNAQFEQQRADLLAKQKQLQRYIADLEYKIANRESRQEDVAKINELMRELRVREEALVKAHKDMQQYKLDLINKETTYNKVFGRAPTVAATAAGVGSMMPTLPSSAPAAPSIAAPPVGSSLQRRSVTGTARRVS